MAFNRYSFEGYPLSDESTLCPFGKVECGAGFVKSFEITGDCLKLCCTNDKLPQAIDGCESFSLPLGKCFTAYYRLTDGTLTFAVKCRKCEGVCEFELVCTSNIEQIVNVTHDHASMHAQRVQLAPLDQLNLRMQIVQRARREQRMLHNRAAPAAPAASAARPYVSERTDPSYSRSRRSLAGITTDYHP